MANTAAADAVKEGSWQEAVAALVPLQALQLLLWVRQRVTDAQRCAVEAGAVSAEALACCQVPFL